MTLPKVVAGPERGAASNEADLAEIGARPEDNDRILAEMGALPPPAEGSAAPASGAPRGFRETGRESIVQEIPGLEFDVADGHAVGEGREIGGHATAIEREVVRDLPGNGEIVGPDRRSAMERVREYVSGRDPSALGNEPISRRVPILGPAMAVVGGDGPMDFAGIEEPTLPSLRRAISGGGVDAAFPTAPRPEGMAASAPDRRMLAPAMGAVQGLTLDNADESFGRLGDLVRGGSGRRDEMRDEQAQAIEQAPGAYSLGAVGGSLPYMAIPGGQETALGRIAAAGGVGLGMGALRGAGEAEELRDVPREAVEGGLTEGAINAATAGVGEAASPLLRRAGDAAEGMIPGLRDRADHAALEARGVWGRRSMEAARNRPGGQAQLARDLDAANFPLDARRSPARIDEILGEAGPRIGAVREAVDEAGGTVDTRSMADRLIAMAEREERAPIGGRQRGEALRRFAADLGELDSMSFADAHQQRRTIDDMITQFSPDPNLSSLAGQRQSLRQIVSDGMGETASSVGLGEQWAGANRDYALGAFMDDYGRGAERLNAQGGFGGAQSRAGGLGRILSGDIGGGASEMLAGPAVQQEARMRVPGLQVRTLRALIPALETGGPALARAARVLRGAQLRGGPAVAAAHWALSRQSPEYRLAVERAEGEQPEESDQ